MQGQVKWLKDKEDNILIPNTLTSAVFNSEGKSVDELLAAGEGGEPAQTIYIENTTTHSTVPFTKIIATTAELIDGESSLEDGVLYLVYEAD